MSDFRQAKSRRGGVATLARRQVGIEFRGLFLLARRETCLGEDRGHLLSKRAAQSWDGLGSELDQRLVHAYFLVSLSHEQ